MITTWLEHEPLEDLVLLLGVAKETYALVSDLEPTEERESILDGLDYTITMHLAEVRRRVDLTEAVAERVPRRYG